MHIIDIVINTRLTLLRPRISFIVKFIDHSNISYFFIIQLLFSFLLFKQWSIIVFLRAKVYFVQILISFQNVTEIEVTPLHSCV